KTSFPGNRRSRPAAAAGITVRVPEIYTAGGISSTYRKSHTCWQHCAALTGGMTYREPARTAAARCGHLIFARTPRLEQDIPEARPAATLDDLRSCLESTGGPLIASVALRFPEDGRHGGHLVVVTAVDEGLGARVCIRDPSSWGKAEDSISAARFSASYSGRVI